MHETTRVPLLDGHVDVDVIGPAVEITVRIGGRAGLGLALSPSEAQRLARALDAGAHHARAVETTVDLEDVQTVADLWGRVSALELEQVQR